MAVDASAVARVLGISVDFQDLRSGGVLYLPQRVAVFAQGSSDASYSTDKIQITSAGQAGSRYGFGSPIHLIARQLFPTNGDGVGTIPVTIYPIEDDDQGVAASGSITPAGSQTKAAAYRVLCNNIQSEAFVIPVGASVTQICRLMHDACAAVLHMPFNPTYTYGTVTATPGEDNGGDGTVTTLSVTGQPIPGDYRLECTSAVADGGVFTLTDPDGTVISEAITMTPGAGGATVITIAGIQFTLTDGSADFEVGDFFTITVPATNVVATAKWAGESSNALYLEVDGEDYGVTFTVVQPTGGLVNPAVDSALAQIGNVWETMCINAQNIEDENALDAFQTFGEGRWGALVKKPLVVFTGNTHTTVADATAISSTRRDDYTNAQLVAPGSKDLPFVVAARQLARIVRVANNNPPHDYGSQRATGLTPGDDAVQWDYLQRDQAVKAGSSTVEIKDGVVNVSDVVTFYHPLGEEPPPYRFVVDIVKLQNIIFNLDLRFSGSEWDGAPLIPDDQPTVNRAAKKPYMAKAAAEGVLDALGLEAIIADAAVAKASTVAAIDSQNPKRLNILIGACPISGNTNVKDLELSWGFSYGQQSVVG